MKPRADRLAARGADRDVLQVRVGGAQPAGGGAGLVEAGVDPPGGGVDAGRQHVDVGGPELLQLPVLEDQARHLVPHGGQLLQHVGVGGRPGPGLLEHRQLVLLEEHLPELLRGIEVEGRAGRRAGSRPRAGPVPLPMSRDSRSKSGRSMAMPAHSMSTSTSTSGISRSSSSGSQRHAPGAAGRRRRAAPAPSRCRRRSRPRPPRPDLGERNLRRPLAGEVGVAPHRRARGARGSARRWRASGGRDRGRSSPASSRTPRPPARRPRAGAPASRT